MTNTANIIIFGPGLVGQALVDSLINAIERYRSPLKIIGLVDSRAAIIEKRGFSAESLNILMTLKRQGISFAEHDNATSVSQIQHLFAPNTILVDTTSSNHLYHILLEGLEQGCSLTMSNKKNLVLPWKIAENFFASPRVHFESTVCAGTPVIATMRNLNNSLDEIHSIEGCLSGTLNYICSQLDLGHTMAKAVIDAHDFGYTEPDPRDDLSGMDVGRKALILARMAGWHLELEDISIEKLYPESMAKLAKDEFFHKLNTSTPRYQQLAQHASAEDMSLRYIASVNAKGGHCYMKAVPKDSELGLLKGTANKVSILTRIHNPIPITISGSGAGAEITALGLLSDILKLTEKIVG